MRTVCSVFLLQPLFCIAAFTANSQKNILFLQFSQGQLSGMLSDKIHLFVHDVNNENMLRLLKPQEELNLKCRDLIEIVVSCKQWFAFM